MILTVDKKKRFLVTMIVIMACATAINYGLYNVLSTYVKTDSESELYSGVQLNIIIILVVIAVVTVIMVILIPKENVSELMSRIENSSSVLTGSGTSGSNLGLGDSVGTDYDKQLDDMVDEDIEEGLDIGEKK